MTTWADFQDTDKTDRSLRGTKEKGLEVGKRGAEPGYLEERGVQIFCNLVPASMLPPTAENGNSHCGNCGRTQKEGVCRLNHNPGSSYSSLSNKMHGFGGKPKKKNSQIKAIKAKPKNFI